VPTPTSPTAITEVLVGQGRFRYRALEQWHKLPADWSFVEVAGVATDSSGNAFVFNRGAHPVIVFDAQGNFLRSWGEDIFVRPHGITIGPDDSVYCVDDGGHAVYQCTRAGRVLLTLGTPGTPSDTGAQSVDYRDIKRAAGPFNYPTNLALATNGDLYVTDGYGNARVHRFSADGRLISSWGEPGAGPGQFHVPHGIAIDAEGIVYVADRENSRIQRFSPEGKFISEWSPIARPCQIAIDSEQNILVAELGYRAGMFAGNPLPEPAADLMRGGAFTGGRVSIYNLQGELQSRWGGGDNPCAPGDFFAPHDISIDARGDLYVGEVMISAGGNRGLVSPDCHSLQKFVRIR
jgi:DNA-binding beta-propeller fold protein YncE